MIYNKKVVALVPMKKHSERIKEKNFRLLLGRPLFHYILITLDSTPIVDEIYINTDSDRISTEAVKISKKIRIIERPPELRGDFVSMNKIIEYDLTQTEADIYLQTHATNPLLRSETIEKAIRVFLKQENKDSLFSVTRHQKRFYFKDGRSINHDPDNLIRTQDLEPIYEENSVLYIFTKESFAKRKRRIGENPIMFETPLLESIDIDDEVSFRIAEIICLYEQNKHSL